MDRFWYADQILFFFFSNSHVSRTKDSGMTKSLKRLSFTKIKKIFRFSGPPLEARQWSSASSRDFSKEDLQEVKSKQINIKNSQFETAHGFYYNDGFIVCDATR